MRTRTRWHPRFVARAALVAAPAVIGVSALGVGSAAAVTGGVVTVAPPAQNALVGTSATVAANETLPFGFGVPVPDVITFTVTSGPNTGRTGTANTPNAPFAYTSNGVLGTDTVQACGTGAPAPCAVATVNWVVNNFSNLGAFGVPAIDFHPDNSRTEVDNFGNGNDTFISDNSGGDSWGGSPFDDGWHGWDPQWDDWG